MAYLDTWFALLAARLQPASGVGFGERGAPGPVSQAAQHFWELASSLAREAVDRELREERLRQHQDADALAQEGARLRALQDELQAADRARTEALEIAREQLAEAVRKTHRLEGRINDLTTENRALADELRAMREAMEIAHAQATLREQEHSAAIAQERERIEANQRRWMGEIETARQEAKKLKPELEKAVTALAAEALACANERQVAAALQKEVESARRVAEVATAQAQVLRSELDEGRRLREGEEARHQRELGERDSMIRGLQWRLTKELTKTLVASLTPAARGSPA